MAKKLKPIPHKHKDSIETFARNQHGNSRICESCPCRHDTFTSESYQKICVGVCAKMYVRGFKKGMIYERNKQREKNNS